MTDGHGHVKPRRDGSKARCGGIEHCAKCATEWAVSVSAMKRKEADAVALFFRQGGEF